MFVELTPDGDGTAFCPSVPLEVDVAGDPVAGVAIGSEQIHVQLSDSVAF